MVPCQDERQEWTGLNLVINLAGVTTGLTKMGSTSQRVKLFQLQQTGTHPATRSQTKWVKPDDCKPGQICLRVTTDSAKGFRTLGFLVLFCFRIPDRESMISDAAARQDHRNSSAKPVNWQLTTGDARIELTSLYPPTR